MSQHKHAWRRVAHVDGCHWYRWSYACECGATADTYTERDVKDNPYSAVWMADEGGERCGRCADLMNGATPKHTVNVHEVAE